MIRDARREHPSLPVRRLCELHGVSRSWFYQQQQREVHNPDEPLKQEIEKVVLEYSGYGYRRVTRELARREHYVNHKRVLRVMREGKLLCQTKRRYQPTTDSQHSAPRFANLTLGLVPNRPNQVWHADLTYVRVKQGFVYVACLLDGFTREVVGWAVSKYIDTALALEALRAALKARLPTAGLIHHSDQGVQYCSAAYIECLGQAGVVPSMSRKGNPYDNAKMESFYKTLKYEEVNLQDYEDLAEAKREIGSFIEDQYNNKRLHSSLGYIPPAEFAARYASP